MDRRRAMELFEKGEAFGVYISVIIMEADGVVYFSPDGEHFFESEHVALKDCLNGAKKVPGKDDK